jgi:hypothetical protein
MFKNGINLNTFIGLLKNLIAYKLDKCTFMGMHDDFIGTMGQASSYLSFSIGQTCPNFHSTGVSFHFRRSWLSSST